MSSEGPINCLLIRPLQTLSAHSRNETACNNSIKAVKTTLLKQSGRKQRSRMSQKNTSLAFPGLLSSVDSNVILFFHVSMYSAIVRCICWWETLNFSPLYGCLRRVSFLIHVSGALMEHEAVFRNPSTKNIFYSTSEASKHDKTNWRMWRFQTLIPFHGVSKVKLNIYFLRPLPHLKQHLTVLGV